jgi:hypothetical protein
VVPPLPSLPSRPYPRMTVSALQCLSVLAPRDMARRREAAEASEMTEAARLTPNAATSTTRRASLRTMASNAARSDLLRRETRSQL